MSDIACIYNMNMVEENEQLEDDLLAGRGMDILFCLMDQLKTRKEIARRLECLCILYNYIYNVW